MSLPDRHEQTGEPTIPKQTSQTARTPGAVRAQPGEHLFDLHKLNQVKGGPAYSSVFGGIVEGDRMIVALMRMPANTVSEPHHHPNEQWIFVLEGEMESVVEGKTYRMGPGCVLYIPSNAVHSGRCLDNDAVFFTVKDSSHSLHGIKN